MQCLVETLDHCEFDIGCFQVNIYDVFETIVAIKKNTQVASLDNYLDNILVGVDHLLDFIEVAIFLFLGNFGPD